MDIELFDSALAATRRSNAPMSLFSVGAALRTRGGDVVIGANVESRVLGLTNCAERAAIQQAVIGAGEETDLADLVTEIVAVDANGVVLAPCGQCRQLLIEYGRSARVWMSSDTTREIRELLPDHFELPEASLHRKLFSRSELHSWRAEVRAELWTLRDSVSSNRRELALERTRAFVFVKLNDRYVIPPGLFSCEPPVPQLELTIQLKPGQGIVGAAVANKRPIAGRPIQGVPSGRPLAGPERDKVHERLDWIVAFPIITDSGDPAAVVAIDGLRADSDDTSRTHVADDVLPGIVNSKDLEGSLGILERLVREVLMKP